MTLDALTLEGVAVRRGGRRLFSGLNLAAAAGEAVALTGANGAGKTSLLRAVAGLVPLEAGRIGFGRADPAEARAGGIHLVGHQDALKPARTAGEELAFWTRWTGGDGAEATARAMGLQALAGLEVRRLSAGQRRRLVLARLIASPRPLWLLDEPLGPLDAGWRVRFGEAMAAHLDRGGMILAAVHDPLPIPARTVELAP